METDRGLGRLLSALSGPCNCRHRKGSAAGRGSHRERGCRHSGIGLGVTSKPQPGRDVGAGRRAYAQCSGQLSRRIDVYAGCALGMLTEDTLEPPNSEDVDLRGVRREKGQAEGGFRGRRVVVKTSMLVGVWITADSADVGPKGISRRLLPVVDDAGGFKCPTRRGLITDSRYLRPGVGCRRSPLRAVKRVGVSAIRAPYLNRWPLLGWRPRFPCGRRPCCSQFYGACCAQTSRPEVGGGFNCPTAA